jgi:hypothetical protein
MCGGKIQNIYVPYILCKIYFKFCPWSSQFTWKMETVRISEMAALRLLLHGAITQELDQHQLTFCYRILSQQQS